MRTRYKYLILKYNKLLICRKIRKFMPNKNCPKCKGTGVVKDAKGVHTCWDCLNEGEFDQHSKEIKDTGIKV